ncbi:Ladderlectin [Merluccius polli]|uniref:Ladderlectin n=1 Tax=Merluccius polli TaxID=89951 RepID=A0AA47N536_MERPO|nr:Ladderlectin [Merluccius polli]
MAFILKSLIKWPSKGAVLKNMPKIIKCNFKRCRCIIDCTEIFIARPSSLTARAQAWSNYKHNNTIKYLIAITPAGAISFLSPGWGGRVSDKQITNESVLADRGFLTRDELAAYGATLRIPHFTKGKKQLSAQEVDTARQLSRVRIHSHYSPHCSAHCIVYSDLMPIAQLCCFLLSFLNIIIFIMRVVLSLLVLLGAPLAVEAATVAATETAVLDQENPAVPGERNVTAGRPQARLNFCLDGWVMYRSKCYYLENNPASWGAAETGRAAWRRPTVPLEYRFLQRLALTGGHPFAWLGGYNFLGEWRWEDGSVFNFHNWESMASTSDYQCLHLNTEGDKGWSNHGCEVFFPYICEMSSNC